MPGFSLTKGSFAGSWWAVTVFLEADDFRRVIATTPLVSLDLVVQGSRGEVLFGQRLNRPARDFWFVPGGRVLKGETLDAAFERLTESELGVVLKRNAARLLGVYEHFYDDSVFGNAPGTHYVVLAYHMRLNLPASRLPMLQHNAYHWLSITDAIRNSRVHDYSRAYMIALQQAQ